MLIENGLEIDTDNRKIYLDRQQALEYTVVCNGFEFPVHLNIKTQLFKLDCELHKSQEWLNKYDNGEGEK